MKCVEVEHGINHLITSQWWGPWTDVRGTNNDINGPQDTFIQSMKWSVNGWYEFEHS